MTGTDRRPGTGHYRSYLLRVWSTGAEEGEPLWHASLESPQTGERLGFASLDRLFAFLSDQTAMLSDASRPMQDENRE